MYDFDCVRAHCLEEALDALARYRDDACLIAGGTDLHVLMRARAKMPKVLISIGSIPELKGVKQERGMVSFGSGLTHAEISTHKALAKAAALAMAASAVGSPQVRNLGTAGGNLANASPAGDLYPPLLALDATVTLASAGGTREVGLETFARGPGSCCAAPDELMSSISFRSPAGGLHSNFMKIGLRNAVAISVANGAIVATASDGKFTDVRIACGAVAPTAIRMRKVEALVVGRRLTAELEEEAARTASLECNPISDTRATGEYRRHVAGVLVSRLLNEAWHELGDAGTAGDQKEMR